MSIDTIIRTISLILAPVVMISSCAIFLNGLFGHYQTISARLRKTVIRVQTQRQQEILDAILLSRPPMRVGLG